MLDEGLESHVIARVVQVDDCNFYRDRVDSARQVKERSIESTNYYPTAFTETLNCLEEKSHKAEENTTDQIKIMTTQPPTTDPDINVRREADFVRFKRYAALTFLVASPILIALPPRKLDHLTVLLGGAFCVSANHITHERTGRSIMDRLVSRLSRGTRISELPSERALEIQARLRAAREKQLREGGLSQEEAEKLRARQEQDKGIAERVWMGGEEEGWRERRVREEQEALAEGRGYGDLIREHVWDVITGGDQSGKKD